MNRIKDVIFLYLIAIPLFYLLIWIERLESKIRERYYKIRGIPYYKLYGKFSPRIVRKDKIK